MKQLYCTFVSVRWWYFDSYR